MKPIYYFLTRNPFVTEVWNWFSAFLFYIKEGTNVLIYNFHKHFESINLQEITLWLFVCGH